MEISGSHDKLMKSHLKNNNHICAHIGSKTIKLESYISYTLANHPYINRVEFGNTLWQNAILPSLGHAAGVWVGDTKTSRKVLLSYQYRCGKAVLKLHSMPSRVATIGDSLMN